MIKIKKMVNKKEVLKIKINEKKCDLGKFYKLENKMRRLGGSDEILNYRYNYKSYSFGVS